MPAKKKTADKKTEPKAEPKAAASKSAHDTLVKRVGAMEDNLAKIAARLGINLADLEP
jgi:hypothetical protein